MFPALFLTASMLAAPRQVDLPDTPPREAVFLAVRGRAVRGGPALALTVPAGKPPERDLLRVWMDQLAVVKPHRPAQHAPPTLQMFITPGTSGGVGLAAFGIF